jgi:hypothetical protein
MLVTASTVIYAHVLNRGGLAVKAFRTKPFENRAVCLLQSISGRALASFVQLHAIAVRHVPGPCYPLYLIRARDGTWRANALRA